MQDITSKRFLLIEQGKDTKNPFDILKKLYLRESKRMFPNVPNHLRTTPKYTDKTIVESTMCITDFIRLLGGEAERINCIRRGKDNRIIYADILAVIQGQYFVIKIQNERDHKGKHKKHYQKCSENNGCLHLTFVGFEQFYNWYLSIFVNTEYETE
jgi:hypothetical protein